ncbi:MAG TPA: aminotransferase class V-fold PLP-dependent enzyme [Membranihabitans sp.]|nr:aminotransferase class V-fold PLP-dependent enzyme [Membranihabitans sp.]
MDRRKFILNSGLALGVATTLPSIPVSVGQSQKLTETSEGYNSWRDVREQFLLTDDQIHMALMLFASHPLPVRKAIEYHREGFDQNPAIHWEENIMYPFLDGEMEKQQQFIQSNSAAKYLECDPGEVAFTDSTTMGLAILYTGLKLNPTDEILTTTHDHYSTEKSLEYSARLHGASIRKISLYDEPAKVTVELICEKLKRSISSRTRIVAVTWVHSSTGVKLPLREMSDVIANENKNRPENKRIYFCVDGVHGFGIENITMEDTGCDFFAAGTHKWMFGPRGTGILWARNDAWDMVEPIIPSFHLRPYGQWLGAIPQEPLTFNEKCSPGGFHSFEYRWAQKEAFDFHLKIGKDKIQERTHQLSSLLKEGLKSISHVTLHTPLDPKLSSGINCFEVAGFSPDEVVKKFMEKRIIASTSPYRESFVRLTPCIINTEDEVKTCLDLVAGLK